MASISNSMDVENDDNNNTNHANLATRYEDVHVKLIDLKIPNIIPLKTETEIPSWALKSTEFLTICGTLHDYLITSLVHDKEIRNLQHASKSFNAVLLLFKLRGSPYPLSNPKNLTGNTFNNYNATIILDFLTTDVQIQRVHKIRLYKEKTLNSNNKTNNNNAMKQKKKSQNSADTTGINQDLIRNCLERIFTHFRISTKDKNKNLSNMEMLDMLHSKVKSLKRKLPDNYFDQTRRLLKRSAQTPEELSILSDISKAMRSDYDVRRQMLIKRLDVTIQSFLWSDKVVGQEDELLNAIDPLIKQLKEPRPVINPKKIFDATPSLREEQEIRVTEASLNSTVKSVIIGTVPDRGGRANEMRPSMRDMMPGWSSRRSGGGGGSRNNYNNNNNNNNNRKKDSRMVFSGERG